MREKKDKETNVNAHTTQFDIGNTLLLCILFYFWECHYPVLTTLKNCFHAIAINTLRFKTRDWKLKTKIKEELIENK
jgi:hypothetical protein